VVAVLPVAFRMSEVFLAVTIDCECDKGAAWRSKSPLRFEGVREGIGLRLGPLFRRFRAKPTYLLSPEVFRHAESLEVFEKQGSGAELGTHLHGEYAEPGAFEPLVTVEFQRDYPPETEAAKLRSLTEAFRGAFGRPPRAFRAGRFGLGPRSIGCLESLGYWVDSSVTPFVSWERSGARGLSYRGAPTQPYRPSPSSPGQPGDSTLVEVPVTIRPRTASRLPWLGRFVPPRWLRPTRTSARAMVALARDEIRAAGPEGRRPVVLNAMFHNVEVIADASPYARTEAQAFAIVDRVRALLTFAASESIRVIGLSDVAELFA
jgi:hypothetical protein